MYRGKRIGCIIPARMGSYRFQDKPFALINGKTMIEHVYKRAALADFIDAVYVATPNVEIKDKVEEFGGNVVMTSEGHKRATERVAEAALILGNDFDIIINLQGDEPLVNPDLLKLSIDPFFEEENIYCVNLAREISFEEAKDVHDVKIVCDKDDNALYFSREPIPSRFLSKDDLPFLCEICIMPFTKESLQLYTKLTMYPLEERESIDMLRWLENGYKVKIIKTVEQTFSVDVPDDIQKVEMTMKRDKWTSLY
jgi:3-deoxy-manno-octulosonate cytidylyltransferase (CMP-KDO synthetase)